MKIIDIIILLIISPLILELWLILSIIYLFEDNINYYGVFK